MTFIVVYITHKNNDDAKKVVNHLLKRKLIACANIFPISSMYFWKGKIVEESEVVTIVKSRKENWENIRKEVEKIHPYEVPCIMKLSASANERYAKWINEAD